MPDITGIHHLSLTVRDLDVSEEFYTRVFGFVRVLELADAEGRGAKRVLAHPGTRTVIGFSLHSTNDGSPFSEFRTGLDHFAIGVASHAELQAWIARLDELGIAHGELTKTAVGEYVAFRDPDNVQLELWANPA